MYFYKTVILFRIRSNKNCNRGIMLIFLNNKIILLIAKELYLTFPNKELNI